MLNKTRQLYNQIVQGRRPSETDEQKIIEDGQAVKNFRQTRVAKLLEDWIEQQRKGQLEYMQVEIGGLTGLGILKFFNAFLKYIYLVQENRAYRKIEAYLDSIERTGEKYEEQRRRRAAAKSPDKQS